MGALKTQWGKATTGKMKRNLTKGYSSNNGQAPCYLPVCDLQSIVSFRVPSLQIGLSIDVLIQSFSG